MPSLEQRDYYARRAMEIRSFADKAQDPEIKTTLETMAGSYDKLVEEADRIKTLRLKLPA